MNPSEMMQFLLGSVGDMLNGDYDDPSSGVHTILVKWINSAGKPVTTTVKIDPNLGLYLLDLQSQDYGRYICVFERIRDFVDSKAFSQVDDATWFLWKGTFETQFSESK